MPGTVGLVAAGRKVIVVAAANQEGGRRHPATEPGNVTRPRKVNHARP